MKKVLVSRLSSLGDILLTQPVLQAVHQNGDEVTLLVKDAYRDLGKLLPGVDHIITPEVADQQKADVVIDLHGTTRSSRTLKKVMAGKKVRYHKYSLSRRLLVKPFGRRVFWNKWSRLKTPQSVIKWYSQAARKVGYRVMELNPQLSFAKVNRKAIIEKLKNFGVDPEKKIAVIAPGAKWATKQWPPAYFAELAGKLSQQQFQVVIIGEEGEKDLSDQITQGLSKSVLSLVGQTSLQELAVLLSMSHVLVSNDSGPMHLGLAAGAQVVALFGPTVAAFGFMPNHQRCHVMSIDLKCKPCSLHGSNRCPLGHHRCLKNISVDDVWQAINRVLGEKSSV